MMVCTKKFPPLLCALLLVFATGATKPTPVSAGCAAQNQAINWLPDTDTRERAKFIKPDDVTRLEFGGEAMVGEQENASLVVEDPKIIDRFLLALRSASRLENPSLDGQNEAGYAQPYRNAHVNIYLKPTAKALTQLSPSDYKHKDDLEYSEHTYGVDKTKGEYLCFSFFTDGPEGCYGPRFWSALHSLSKIQAANIRRTVQAVREQVVAYRFMGYIGELEMTDRVSAPADVAAFVDALCQVDEQAYQWDFFSKNVRQPILHAKTELELRGGKKVPLIISMGPLASDPARSPEWLRTLYKAARDLPVSLNPMAPSNPGAVAR